ncbi:hypothetical protein P3T76_014005 [Phytophthora citrophthora]|uniref:Uncharacterized protein n=1 Tax=Phytophthora citrophthora TaxID=4793 RepID=A0AAD9LCU4_9STRA|nr:hypothetical protein P3T76_014005 [Phytophthora citrophthora]
MLWYTRLAQSVERWPFKPVVVGSSPTGGACFFAIFRQSTSKTIWLLAFDASRFAIDPERISQSRSLAAQAHSAAGKNNRQRVELQSRYRCVVDTHAPDPRL